ncbi:hypothetical protein [Kamptonema formosum]|nr:hypothetical protein [Oscillatoria sp. PCC 10802]
MWQRFRQNPPLHCNCGMALWGAGVGCRWGVPVGGAGGGLFTL